jgi:hypothetical protein
MRTTTILLTFLASIAIGSAQASTTNVYKAALKPQGAAVCILKSQPDGISASLYKHTKVNKKSQADVGKLEPSGDWNLDSYALTAVMISGQPEEVFWQHQRSYFALQANISPEDVRVLDVSLQKNLATVLFVSGGSTLMERWSRSQSGVWSRDYPGCVPVGEIAWIDRIVVKGQIQPNETIHLDYKNGDMEKWSFSTSRLARLVEHNDLKWKYTLPDGLYDQK